ncbi:ATP-grasp fold amidoligase family protein [Paraburkholderia azotifigens]|uniref:ATP-grasp fold amidoligase family protein n=2 Tax=Paraburkholderia azotifigens TaxID=2057004 RepID=A0ABU9RHK4_9BURK|nr:ATP-grasp fold amidoligase family protein [Paraburkholderia azotifigens]
MHTLTDNRFMNASRGSFGSKPGRPDKVESGHLQAAGNPVFRRRLRDEVKALLPDIFFLSLLHRKEIGRFPNLFRPRTYNEHILKRSLAPDPRYARLSDKLAVRDYVRGVLGQAFLVPLISAPAEFTPAVFDGLPDSFVMKANHGSSFVKLVHDKSEVSFEALQHLASRWLLTNFYRNARERHYKHIAPRLFFESLLLDRSGNIPADYKVHCFRRNSERPRMYIQHISDRFGPDTRGNIYDVDWNHLDLAIGEYVRSAVPAPPPANLAALLEAAAALSEGFDYVRVDLYVPDDDIYFGELTFTPGAGVAPMFPDQMDFEWGEFFASTVRHSPTPEL